MSSKKQKPKDQFPDKLIREWENSDGVNFAIAMARATGWLLHVDWWTPSQGADIDAMKSLRVYVGTDGDAIYDCNGKKRIQAYNQYVIQPILRKLKITGGGVTSRYYSEEKLRELPLRIKASEAEIAKATEALQKYPTYLAKVPVRSNLHIPAQLAAEFTFGKCAVFAAVKQELSGLPATAIIVSRYIEAFSLSKLGFCHSIVIHPDGDWEDAWGKQAAAHILARHGIATYTLSEQKQNEVVDTLRKNSPELYERYEQLARTLINS